MGESIVSDTWQVGGAYDRYMGRWSRGVAPLFLTWLAVPPERRWLDVGCGTGALCSAIQRHGSPEVLIGVDPSEGFLATAKVQAGASVILRAGSADAIPLRDSEVDVVVSGLVLNFLPDLSRGLAEMARVAARGGTVAGYVWDYSDGMDILRHFWDAAAALDDRAAHLHEGTRFGLCRPDALRCGFEHAGLGDVAVTPIEIAAVFTTFEDYWEPFLGAQGPAPAYVASIPEDHRVRLRELLRSRLPARSDGSIALRARSWAVRGTTPAR